MEINVFLKCAGNCCAIVHIVPQINPLKQGARAFLKVHHTLVCHILKVQQQEKCDYFILDYHTTQNKYYVLIAAVLLSSDNMCCLHKHMHSLYMSLAYECERCGQTVELPSVSPC